MLCLLLLAASPCTRLTVRLRAETLLHALRLARLRRRLCCKEEEG